MSLDKPIEMIALLQWLQYLAVVETLETQRNRRNNIESFEESSRLCSVFSIFVRFAHLFSRLHWRTLALVSTTGSVLSSVSSSSYFPQISYIVFVDFILYYFVENRVDAYKHKKKKLEQKKWTCCNKWFFAFWLIIIMLKRIFDYCYTHTHTQLHT